MKRRDVLKAVTVGLPAVALGSRVLFAKGNSTSTNLKTLNLVVEGPFVCLLGQTQAEIFAFRVEKHLYQVDYSAAHEGTYRLKGAQGVSDARDIQYVTPQGAEALRLSLEELHLVPHLDKAPYFSFQLPLPKKIVAVLSREAEIIDAFGRQRNVMMPTAYAFVYDVNDFSQLRLDGDNEWKPERKLTLDHVVNLSVATGLPHGVQDQRLEHFHMAWAQLTNYLPGLKLQIISVREERRTAELLGYPGIEPRDYVPYCTNGPIIVVPNPKPPQNNLHA